MTPRDGYRAVGFVAAAVVVGGLFLPWARLTLEVLGAQSPAFVVKGKDIGSDIGDIPWAWFVAGSGLLGCSRSSRTGQP